MFGRKKGDNIPVKEIIPENIKVCSLYSFEKNKFGTEVRSSKILCKEDDGYSFDHKGAHFIIYSVDWDGKKTVSYTSSIASGSSTSNTKRKGRVLGAAIGTAIAPGVGTVIGAAYGTGNKKTKTETVGSVDTIEREQETFSNIKLTLKYKDGIMKDVLYKCLEKDAQVIIGLVEQESYDDSNSIQMIKDLKELLDIGAITQEEFDTKKAELLNKI